MGNEKVAAACITAIIPLFDNSKKGQSKCILYAIYGVARKLCLFILCQALENALKNGRLGKQQTRIPGLITFKEPFRAFFATIKSSPTGLYSKGVNPSSGAR